MLFYETIAPETLMLLKKIQSLEEFEETRLVGGTALALQIGHRKSIDLDFFGKAPVSLDELVVSISPIAQVKPISSSKLMRFLVVDGVKVDVVNYPYAWIDDPVMENGIVLAGIKDIAAMKLSAITNRGTKKDFIDCYFLLQKFSMQELLKWYEQKYSASQLFTVIKSLTYFEDAENDPMPDMVEPLEWSAVKDFIQETVKGVSIASRA